MVRTFSVALLSGLLVVAQARAQEVIIVREAKPKYPKAQAVVPTEIHVEKAVAVKTATPEKPVAVVAKTETRVPEKSAAMNAHATTSKPAAVAAKSDSHPAKQDVDLAKQSATPIAKSETASTSPVKTPVAAIASTKKVEAAPVKSPEPASQTISFRGDSAFIKLADGFDFPVGKPDAQGYYKARGFRSRGHLGEDWDGVGGGDTDLGDPIWSIADGVVVFARDVHMGWGNCIIVRYSYREGGSVKNIDALYGHLNSMLVRRGQAVARGQKIATMGNAHGLYDAHLHLEIRKNIEIGMSRAAFARDFSNYYDPSQFIASHRHLQTNGGMYRVALNTFTQDARINFDKARNYSHPRSGGGTSESAAALKRALASKP